MNEEPRTNNKEQAKLRALAPAQLVDSAKGETAGSVIRKPVRIEALTNGVIDHWYWGRLAFDLKGMFRRGPQAPIDWGHDSETILGHFTEANTNNDRLEISGVLLARTADPEHKAHEVIELMGAGQLYQASIDFASHLDGDWEGIYVQEGQSVLANGQTYAGPLTLFTKWPLNAVAIYPHGYDPNTSAELVPAQLSAKLPQGHPMSKPATLTPPPDVPAKEVVSPQLSVVSQPSETAELTLNPPSAISHPPAQLTAATLTEWSSQFGAENAIAWMTAGKTHAEASGMHIKNLNAQLAAKDAEIAKLTAKLSQLRPGIAEPTGAAIEAEGESASKLTPTERCAQAIDSRLAAAK